MADAIYGSWQLGQLDDPVAGALDVMSQSLDVLVDAGLWSLTDDQVTADVQTISAVQARVDELSARLAQAADQRELARRAGAT